MLLNTYTDSIDFNAVTGWVHDTLNAWLPSWGATLVECVLIGLCLLLLYAVIALALGVTVPGSEYGGTMLMLSLIHI